LNKRRALIIVEPDFLTIHVGVRRVIFYYVEKLINDNYEIQYATPRDKKIYPGELILPFDKKKESGIAYWTSSNNNNQNAHPVPITDQKNNIIWSEKEIDPDQYDLNLITNPWLCSLGLPPLPKSIGLVYDLIPNLIACGILRFSQEINIYDFAKEHDIGFRYYLANTKIITCISDSTRNDFIKYYRSAKNHPCVITDVPFKTDESETINTNENDNILLVNALDYRKNFSNIEKVLSLLATHKKFKLNIVGKERIPIEEAINFCRKLSDLGIETNWYRENNDECLFELYRNASVLFFPSIYEGLGLPILESQSVGVPVISSSTSSCKEINMNPNLCFPPEDTDAFLECLSKILDGQVFFKKGQNLKNELVSFINSKKNITKLPNLDDL